MAKNCDHYRFSLWNAWPYYSDGGDCSLCRDKVIIWVLNRCDDSPLNNKIDCDRCNCPTLAGRYSRVLTDDEDVDDDYEECDMNTFPELEKRVDVEYYGKGRQSYNVLCNVCVREIREMMACEDIKDPGFD